MIVSRPEPRTLTRIGGTMSVLIVLVMAFSGCQFQSKNQSVAVSELDSARSADPVTSAGAARTAGFEGRGDVNAANADPSVVPASASSETRDLESDTSAPAVKINRKQSLAESFLFQPLKYPRGFNRLVIEGQRVTFRSEDDTVLDGRFFRAPRSKGVVVYCHGNGGNLVSRAPRMQQMQELYGYSFFVFDYRGYGRSEGKPTISGALADGRAAVREAARLAGVQPSDVIVMGRSLGGAIAIQLANEFNSPKLIVESSFTSFRDIAKKHVGLLSGLTRKDDLTSERDIARYQGHVLISHGTRDKVVPVEHGERLYAAANEPKQFFRIEDGGHNDPLPESYLRVLGEFLDRRK